MVPDNIRPVTQDKMHQASLNELWSNNMYDAERELYNVIKFVLKEQCSDIIARVPIGCGYELLRLLALKYDR